MGVTENIDEPSMDDILACVRRILAEEEAGGARANPGRQAGNGELILTRMIAADGSVVTISPKAPPNGWSAPPPASTNPFAAFEALKQRVAALTWNTPCAGTFAAKNGLAVRRPPEMPPDRYDFAETVQPASLDGAAASLARRGKSRGTQADRNTGVRIAPDQSNESSAPSTAMEREPPPTAGAGRHRQSRGTALGVTSLAATTGVSRRRQSAPLEIQPEMPEPIEATNHVERMLAHQIAAAHEAAMRLAGAAVHSIHEAAEASSEGKGRKGNRSTESARLADSAARMMRAYNEGLATLALLRGAGTQNVAGHPDSNHHGGSVAKKLIDDGSVGRSKRERRRRAAKRVAAAAKISPTKRIRTHMH